MSGCVRRGPSWPTPGPSNPRPRVCASGRETFKCKMSPVPPPPPSVVCYFHSAYHTLNHCTQPLHTTPVVYLRCVTHTHASQNDRTPSTLERVLWTTKRSERAPSATTSRQRYLPLKPKVVPVSCLCRTCTMITDTT